MGKKSNRNRHTGTINAFKAALLKHKDGKRVSFFGGRFHKRVPMVQRSWDSGKTDVLGNPIRTAYTVYTNVRVM